MKFTGLFLLIFCILSLCHGKEIFCYSLSLPPDITRADLYYLSPPKFNKPKVVLVLCPGVNGNGRHLVAAKNWQEFVRKHNMGLVGLSFASPTSALRNKQGYYYPERGSGKILISGINKIFGRNTKIIMYGFSGGAHFTARFAEWIPARVIAWCSYSAMWWDPPLKHKMSPPGLIICGSDDQRLGASLSYFKEGRAIGRRWLWLEIPNNGHSPQAEAEEFVREYFAEIIATEKLPSLHNNSGWLDIDTGEMVTEKDAQRTPSVTAWLPNISLLKKWKQFTEAH